MLVALSRHFLSPFAPSVNRSPSPPLVTLHERARIERLKSLMVLDTAPETAFDDLTRLAATLLHVPIALVSLVDGQRQWFKSRVGMQALQTPREMSFCAHAIQQPDRLFVVPDTAVDDRFRHNPLVTGAPGIRFYAGAPLLLSDGHAVGTLCAIDTVPRQPGARELDDLHFLASQVVQLLESRGTRTG